MSNLLFTLTVEKYSITARRDSEGFTHLDIFDGNNGGDGSIKASITEGQAVLLIGGLLGRNVTGMTLRHNNELHAAIEAAYMLKMFPKEVWNSIWSHLGE